MKTKPHKYIYKAQTSVLSHKMRCSKIQIVGVYTRIQSLKLQMVITLCLVPQSIILNICLVINKRKENTQCDKKTTKPIVYN